MKDGIHPPYNEVVIRCACGEEFKTHSTRSGVIRVDVCSKCHPFFTGKQKFVDSGGRVDKFRKRMDAARQHQQQR
ncbi:MAG TPA: 50S ribosomal protein L31 [Bacillota bacterium]|nr:50S ribosomal protein L31 [Bacillota bacterium]